MEIKVRNVNDAVARGFHYLIQKGVKEESRNGDVLVFPEHMVTVYSNPNERVLFSHLRDANPFFHLMESLWMLYGRDDLAFPVQFNKRFAEYSDDGNMVHGAYGFRWRNSFGFDQLTAVINELKKNPKSRRCVLSMWDPTPHSVGGKDDLFMAMNGGKDVPCNTHAYFNILNGKLNMTVCCRSNDVVWGAYGANVVHFSVLQEYIAAAVGVGLGTYTQMSNNYHAYTDIYNRNELNAISIEAHRTDWYSKENVKPAPLVNTSILEWDKDLELFFSNRPDFFVDPLAYSDRFFSHTVQPMYQAWMERKNKQGTGIELAKMIEAQDWRIACVEWIQRREIKNVAT